MMEKKHQRAMLASIVHIVNGDWASLVYDLTEMDVVPPRTNLRRVTMVSHQIAVVHHFFADKKNLACRGKTALTVFELRRRPSHAG
jgi:hypothetical protein